MTVAVLDASAILALLQTEPGHERVRAVLADAAASTVNLGEVVGYLARHGAAAEAVRRVLDPLPFERVPFGEELAYGAGLLLPVTRSAGLSLGDRACLALARQLGVKCLTADRSWLSIAEATGVEIELIR